MTAEHDKRNSTQIGRPKKCNYEPHAVQTNTHMSFPSTHTWPHLWALHHTDKPQTQTPGPPPPASCLHTRGLASASRQAGTRARPWAQSPSHPHPAARTHARRPIPSQPARRGSGGSRVWGQGPGRGGWGGAGAPRGRAYGAWGGDEGRARGGARLTWAGGSS